MGKARRVSSQSFGPFSQFSNFFFQSSFSTIRCLFFLNVLQPLPQYSVTSLVVGRRQPMRLQEASLFSLKTCLFPRTYSGKEPHTHLMLSELIYWRMPLLVQFGGCSKSWMTSRKEDLDSISLPSGQFYIEGTKLRKLLILPIFLLFTFS